ncbi:hypothetical protein JCM14076_14010 [Methylosoma difficile]
MKKSYFIIGIILPLFSQSVSAISPLNTEHALTILKNTCSTPNAKLDVKVSGDLLQVQSFVAEASKGRVLLSKKELDALVAPVTDLSNQQPVNVRHCIQQELGKLFNAMAASSAEEIIFIKTDGNYFVTEEFDKVITTVSTNPTKDWGVDDVVQQSGMSPAKVRLYLEIAAQNKLGIYTEWKNSFEIGRKGLSYVLIKEDSMNQ